MLKKFFITMLGTMAGFWLSVFIFVIGILVTCGVLAASALGGSKSLTDSNILHITLEGELAERQGEFDLMTMLQGGMPASENLSNITSAILMAAEDNSIKGIFLDCKGSTMGLAANSEISAALKKFKKSGKWVFAYADNYSQADYCVASGADRICLNPVGMIELHGLGSTTIFFKNLLDKLGVDVQVVKVGEFKSAVEPYIRTNMSEPSRLQTEVFLNQIWGVLSQNIAANRGVSVAEVNQWADDMCMTWDPQRYVDIKAIDELCYRSEAMKWLCDKVGVGENSKLPLVSPSEYAEVKGLFNDGKSKKHIAVLYAVGEITQDGMGGIASERLIPEIEKLKDNEDVVAMVLRVNSPGGSAFASEQIWKALQEFKAEGKTLYVSMGDYAASGGYYISAGADKIFADSTTITGSIGIFGVIPSAQKLLTDKIGLNFQTVETNKNATFPSLYAAGNTQQIAAMQSYVERGYETFVSRVAQGRDLSPDSVKVIGGGRVWDGISALNLGLVDELGTLHDAVDALAKKLKISSDRVVAYPEQKDAWMQWLSQMTGMDAEASFDLLKDNEIVKAYLLAKHIDDLYPIQARMEPIIIE